jgi:uncharacterized membrane protein
MKGTDRRRRTDPPRRIPARLRVGLAAALGIVVGIAAAFVVPWQLAVLVAWDATALAYVCWVWWTVHHMEPRHTRAHATAIDESAVTANVVLILACLVSLIGVGFDLLRASGQTGGARALDTALGVLTVVLSWIVVHVVFMLRYADIYYRQDAGIDFHPEGAEGPDYRDFAYVAFTIGMTYQVSDTDLTTKDIRRAATRHALLSFVFGTAVIAMTINVVAGLLNH